MAEATSVAPLPRTAVEEDHRLEGAERRSLSALMKHRWHWTLDESNPRRVSFTAYAKQVGRGRSVIGFYAVAQTLLDSRACSTPEEAIERARASTEQYEATLAVAKERGVDTTSVRSRYGNEVRDVRRHAHERAIERGTSPREEITHAARTVVTARKSASAQTERRKNEHSLHWFHIEGWLGHAQADLVKSIEEALLADLDREERDLLLHSLGQVQEGVRLTREAITGGATATAVTRRLEVLKGGMSA